ncbi:hypothetical protein [Falsiroseomonas oryzae]|uniref:hypothetical protein n=1 Tax=Falsiroseomonas oryzae TaxID=2766473 RepID=UPI0022EA2414|nr:hypothetical protein [Roseomonas sp. MO-31]
MSDQTERLKALLAEHPEPDEGEPDEAYLLRLLNWLWEWLEATDNNEKLYGATGNPVYAFREIERRLRLTAQWLVGDEVDDDTPPSLPLLVPDWALQCLLKALRNLSALTWLSDPAQPRATRGMAPQLDPDSAMQMVPAALGLSRRGWNGFGAAHADWWKGRAADTYDRMRDGEPPEYAEAFLRNAFSGIGAEGVIPALRIARLGDGTDPADARRSMRRLLAEGRRLRTKPNP